MTAHRLARQVRPLRRAAVIGFREEIAECDGVEQTLSWHVAVAAITRCGPRESLLDEMLTDPVGADAKIRSGRTSVRHEPVREEHQLAVPFRRNLDAIQPAVVLAEDRVRARQRLERGIAGLPRLIRARNRRDAGTAKRGRRLLRQRGDGHRENGGTREGTEMHKQLP